MIRQRAGRETWTRLREWDRGQADSERLAAQILLLEGFSSVDPSHPLGGRDGLKDVMCSRNGKRWVGAAYFPRGQREFREVKDKFLGDVRGVTENEVDGFAFVTNQELRLSEREALQQAAGCDLELFHLERVGAILNSPPAYGIRLEYLDVEMTKEEQLGFFAVRDELWSRLDARLERVLSWLDSIAAEGEPSEVTVPVDELREFKALLDSITGYGASVAFSSLNMLRPPVDELREFKALLDSITGYGASVTFTNLNMLRPPVDELREFKALLDSITGYGASAALSNLNMLRPPLTELREYEAHLDRVLEKQRGLGGRAPEEMDEDVEGQS